MHHRRVAVVGVLAASLAFTSSASADLDEVNTKKLREGVTVNGILQHERAFQQIANVNGGTRASGTPGYEASLGYVRERLKKAGYKVSVQEFKFPFFRELAPAELEQVSPAPKTYETGTFDYSGSGEVTAPLQEVRDNLFPPPAEPGSTAGCEEADFQGFTPGNIALIQRGGCDFAVKVDNAVKAQASAVIIFNEGQEGRQEMFVGTLGGEKSVPVVGLSFADAQALHQQLAGGQTVRMRVETLTENTPDATTWNLLADSKQGDKSQTVVVGAHLDSVAAGPGINDNGSGTAGILEIAEEMAELKVKPHRQVRFAFWGAEEAGLLGSEHYVESLGTGVSTIYANLNFDMIGSPNYVRFVYDGDGNPTGTAGPPGSAQIEALFNRYFASQGLASDPTAFDGRSDYGPFIAAGVPAGGLFTGAEGVKTAEQAAKYGGTAGEPYDPCYHEACDDITNLSTAALNEMSDAAAHATLTLAKSKSGFFEDGSRVGKRQKNGKKFSPHGHERR